MAQEQFGEEGIPKEITFSEIEEIGHQVGQLAAGTVDQTLQVRHAEHLGDVESRPGCGRVCAVQQRQRDAGEATLVPRCAAYDGLDAGLMARLSVAPGRG